MPLLTALRLLTRLRLLTTLLPALLLTALLLSVLSLTVLRLLLSPLRLLPAAGGAVFEPAAQRVEVVRELARAVERLLRAVA